MTPTGPTDRDDELEALLRLIASDRARLDDPGVRRAVERIYGRTDALELLREIAREEKLIQLLHVRTGIDSGEAHGARLDSDPGVPSIRLIGLRVGSSAKRTRWRTVGLAAAAALVIGIASSWSAISSFVREVRSATRAASVTVATRAAEVDTVSLPDGSRAILAPNSSLNYSMAPLAGPRELWLDGEALFDVKHDDDRPFRVRTRRAMVEDLGTSFVVREYAEDSRARVAVRSGAAALHTSNNGSSAAVIDLRPGDGAYVDSAGTIARFSGDPESFGSWTGGYLTFDGAPLPEVLAQLATWYGVEFQMTDTVLVKQHFTGGLSSTSLSKTLDILGPIVHARFAQEGRVVAVTARPAGH